MLPHYTSNISSNKHINSYNQNAKKQIQQTRINTYKTGFYQPPICNKNTKRIRKHPLKTNSN